MKIYGCLIFLVLCSLSTIDTSTAQTGVCSSTISRQQSITRYYSVPYIVGYNCDFFRRCTRTLYRRVSRVEQITGYERVLGCCPGYQRVGLICQRMDDVTGNEEVRLVGGASSYEGRVEVFLNGRWGTVCDDFWDVIDVRVVCRQLGHSDAQFTPQAFRSAYFGEGTGAINMDNVQCSGTETRLTSCRHRTQHDCTHEEDAGVRCRRQCTERDLRLSGGSSVYEGRVEVCLGGGWETVCDDSWSINDARVVCRQLGYTNTQYTPQVFLEAHFGEGTGAIGMDDVHCSGTETLLTSCIHTTDHNCIHQEDAGVRCSQCEEMSVQLSNGTSVYEGRVEVCLGGGWGTVCDTNWNVDDARVVCRQLGYENTQLYAPLALSGAQFGEGTGAISMNNVQCSGTETLLISCTHTTNHSCTHMEDAGVRCRQCMETSIRLRGGSSAHEGRVEVCLGGGWGTVCDDGWDTSDATVACRQLAFNTNGATSLRGAFFGQGTRLPIAMDNVRCSSAETHLVNCTYLGADAVRSCTHAEDSGVRCLPFPPKTAPSEVAVAVLSSTSLRVSWVPPVAGDWNGQMEGFKITIRDIDSSASSTITVSNSAATSHTISSLHPYYRYQCRVAAYNSGGNGPFSSLVTTQLPQDSPSGVPQDVIAIIHFSRSFSLSWRPPLPEERNGIITQYTVRTNDTSAGQCFLTQTTDLNLTFPAGSVTVMPYRTYILQVAAETTVGQGPFSTETIVHTLEDPPTSVGVTRVSATEILVSWIDTKYAESYFIQFRPVEGDGLKRTDGLVVVIETNQTVYQIIGLSPGISYAVAVAARNSPGRGSFSEEIIAELFNSSSFVLLMSGAIVCEPWLMQDADTKLRAMLQVMSSQLMLNYSSSLDLNYIAQTHLSCQTEASDVVILRGTLVGTAEKSGAELHQMLQEWVDAGQTLQIAGTSLELLVCSTYPESANTCFEIAATTSTPVTVSDSEFQSGGITLYGGVGGGMALLVIVTIFIVVLVVTCSKKRKKKTDSHVGIDTPGQSDDTSSASKKQECELYHEAKDEGHIYENPYTLYEDVSVQNSVVFPKPSTMLQPTPPILPGLSKRRAGCREYNNSSSDVRYSLISQQLPRLTEEISLEAKRDFKPTDTYDDYTPMTTQIQPSTTTGVNEMPITSSMTTTKTNDKPQVKPKNAKASAGADDQSTYEEMSALGNSVNADGSY